MKFQNSKFYFLSSAFSFVLLLSTLYFLASGVHAAELSVTPLQWELGPEEEFEVLISIAAEDEAINAVSGVVAFPENLLELREVREANSIVSFWIERPTPEHPVFSGIIPGGYGGKNGLLFSLVFKAKQSGNGIIGLENMQLLLNDGKGTQAPLTVFQLAFAVNEKGISARVPGIRDEDPPEKFQPLLVRNSALFEGRYTLVWSAKDKGSGISHYEIREERWFGLAADRSLWQRGESPHVLTDQKLKSRILVKAVDKNGNETIALVRPQGQRWYEKYLGWGIIIAIGGAAYVARKKFKNGIRRA